MTHQNVIYCQKCLEFDPICTQFEAKNRLKFEQYKVKFGAKLSQNKVKNHSNLGPIWLKIQQIFTSLPYMVLRFVCLLNHLFCAFSASFPHIALIFLLSSNQPFS